MEILEKDNYNILKNKSIHILHYPGSGNVLYISKGEYLGTYNINGFYHNAPTEPGSGEVLFSFFLMLKL